MSAEMTSGREPVTVNRPRVLIVDDDQLVSRSLERVLKHDFEVEIRSDGESAIQALRAQEFDVVISDIRLPTISGVELLRNVRSYDLDLPVILISGAPSVQTAIEAVDLGALKYITKPVDTALLHETVSRAVSLRRLAAAKRDAFLLLGADDAGPGDRAGLMQTFGRAIDSLWPAYQPIVDAQGTLVAYEALMRSREPALPHPGAVIDAAEKLGRLNELGARMRDLAAEGFATAAPDALLFVNLHPQDLLDPHLVSKDSPLSRIAERVVLEITERARLENISDVQSKVRALRTLGFRIAIDDLGAGYAGLTSFAVLEPDVVKLDMSLVRGIDASDVRQRVVRSMTTLCKDMNMRVVAEGIETAAEWATVRAIGCEWLQGYLFARPGPAFPSVINPATA